MSNDPAAAVDAPWRQGVDGALETVEGMRFAGYHHFE
jgi:hypothetical protein